MTFADYKACCRMQGCPGMIASMNTIAEIETAIERLPAPQVDELAAWLEQLRQRRTMPLPVEAWLDRARGAALPGATTDELLALTREKA
jgi:hypothetical protein